MRSTSFFRRHAKLCCSLALLLLVWANQMVRVGAAPELHGFGGECDPSLDSQNESPAIDQVDVFVSGQEGYRTFRIPSIVQAQNSDLLAFCEGRRQGSSDSGDIDLVMKRSSDRGATWSKLRVLWDDGPNTCGNPCAVVDQSNGTLWLLSTHNLGQDHESEIIQGTSEGTRTVWALSSEDHGETWSQPKEITANTKRPNWTWYATGPGAGIQLERGPHQGRLVVPCDHIEAKTNDYYSHVIFSDDHGATWQLGGNSPEAQVNECEVAELEDGALLLNMRNYDRTRQQRQIAFSSNGGLTWRDQTHDEALIEPICQASLRRLRWAQAGPATQKQAGVLLFSNPASTDAREKLTLRASYDDGVTWPYEYLLYPGSSAYSCLVGLDPQTFGCLFEVDHYGRIVFVQGVL